jgi:hypothetical protein
MPCPFTFNGIHGVISQKIVVFKMTALRTSDPTCHGRNFIMMMMMMMITKIINGHHSPKFTVPAMQYTFLASLLNGFI